MPLAIPPELKKITPFVRRAEELDKDKQNPESRLVAYYCRQYAVHMGIPLATVEGGGKNVLGALLTDLEKEKAAMNNFTREEAQFLCQRFADNIFQKANDVDRAGAADKNTGKTFYAAASFIEMCNQFYQDDNEILIENKKRIKYAKWKATDILTAIKEGRTPTPGAYGEDEENLSDEEEEEATKQEQNEEVKNKYNDNNNSNEEEQDTSPAPVDAPVVETVQYTDDDDEEEDDDDVVKVPMRQQNEEEEDEKSEEGTEVELGPPPSYPGASAPPPAYNGAHSNNNNSYNSNNNRPPMTFNPPSAPPPPAPTAPLPKPSAPPAAAATEQPKKSTTGMFGFGKKKQKKLSRAEISDAMECAKFAIAALEDRDTDLAAERLQQALQCLGR